MQIEIYGKHSGPLQRVFTIALDTDGETGLLIGEEQFRVSPNDILFDVVERRRDTPRSATCVVVGQLSSDPLDALLTALLVVGCTVRRDRQDWIQMLDIDDPESSLPERDRLMAVSDRQKLLDLVFELIEVPTSTTLVTRREHITSPPRSR